MRRPGLPVAAPATVLLSLERYNPTYGNVSNQGNESRKGSP